MGRGTRKQTKHKHEPNLNLKTKYDLNARFFKLQKYFFLKKKDLLLYRNGKMPYYKSALRFYSTDF